jgi:hypothetical protein
VDPVQNPARHPLRLNRGLGSRNHLPPVPFALRTSFPQSAARLNLRLTPITVSTALRISGCEVIHQLDRVPSIARNLVAVLRKPCGSMPETEMDW